MSMSPKLSVTFIFFHWIKKSPPNKTLLRYFSPLKDLLLKAQLHPTYIIQMKT